MLKAALEQKYLRTRYSKMNPATFRLGKTRGKNAPAGQAFLWTNHSRAKMNQYRLTESRIKRIIRHPARTEEGILPRAIAAMSPAEGKRYSEIWVMYVVVSARGNSKFPILNSKQLKVITAWRYPGRAPQRDPVPAEILREIKKIF